jgi:hypothetical protein
MIGIVQADDFVLMAGPVMPEQAGDPESGLDTLGTSGGKHKMGQPLGDDLGKPLGTFHGNGIGESMKKGGVLKLVHLLHGGVDDLLPAVA